MLPILTLALARPTFDVPYAESFAAQAFAAIDAAGLNTIGPRDLLFDAGAARAAIAGISPREISGVLVLQVTFTDASMTVEIAKAFPGVALGLWAFPEPRAGGRLRLNSFCGLNLAAHALGRAALAHATLYADAGAPDIGRRLQRLVAGPAARPNGSRPAALPQESSELAAIALHAKLRDTRIGLIGEHPGGFDTCRYDPAMLKSLANVSVEPIALHGVFERARAVAAPRTAARLDQARQTYAGIEAVDQDQLAKSMALGVAMEDLLAEKALDSLAVRCWPETFTEYGCAVCGPMGMLTEAGTPCACEADVLGALTSLLLQGAAQAPAWLVDIVDIDAASDTGVFWHCGSAPASMRDPEVRMEAQIHSNRKMPLLAQFTLKPGRITIARLSQARNGLTLVLGGATVIPAPMSFTGTSAVARFDGGAGNAMEVLLGEALEHHVAMVYGDHRETLEAWAALNDLPVLDLTPALTAGLSLHTGTSP